MAVVKVNPNFKTNGWGFTLVDSLGNAYSMKNVVGQAKIPDRIATQFVSDKRVFVEFDNPIYAVNQPVKEVKKVKPKFVYDENELFGLKKKEQVKILKDFGVYDIPRYEDERVKKILELQKKR